MAAISSLSFWKRNGFTAANCLLAFAIPASKSGIVVPILIWILAWLISPKRSPDKTERLGLLLLAGVFAFHIIGMLYTENIPRGFRDLEQKSSLLIFPLFMAFSRPFSARASQYILLSFVVGTIVSVILAFASSGLAFAETGLLTEFYMSEFSEHHPSYIAFYINFAIAVILWFSDQKSLTRKWTWFLWVLIILLSLSLVFPASKMGFINFGFLVFFFLVKWALNKKLWSYKSAALVFTAFLFGLFLKFDPIAAHRVNAAINYVQSEERQGSEVESNNARAVAWEIAVDEIKQHPMGVGTGDINDVLVKRFRRDGFEALAEKNLNPHNNFLQIALALGLPALLWFVLSLLYPLRIALARRDSLYLFFILSVIMNFAVESMLEKQSGVIFYAFIHALFFFLINANVKSDGN